MDRFCSLYAGLVAQGATVEAALSQLRVEGATPVEAIKAIREVQGISLGEAKQIFSQSPAWSKEVLAGNALHDEVISLLERESKS